ncbi:related to non-snRNP spliceosome component (pre-mRNA splicing protein PRP19) [Cephalotrichum gorgonifer]|uniref:Pre-mRNA-processing factor 19 n=1 Tax=Cephalotrichum gorgonifer TaxID=2041049 RepID=A0AAE8SW11_9PEZI|nr:related to non-snRNP spliceosome component (pre-mRNA splicing protein PRP19) [Cephalotrichum gorgonifer]
MLCAISGEAPQEPVISKNTGILYEKRLIEKYIEEHGTEPSGEAATTADLLPLKTDRTVRPRPPTLTSIPALLAAFQNEWDSVALGTRTLMEELARTREELSTALYQNDAAKRVVARLVRERDEAREALSKLTVSGGGGAAANGDAMVVDSTQGLSDELSTKVNDTHQKLSKGRKKRPIPEGWATGDHVSAFKTESSTSLPFSQISGLAIEGQGSFAAVASHTGDVAIYAIDEGKVERQLTVDDPVTDELWAGTRLIVATAKGSVKLIDGGKEVLSVTEHAGAVTALSLHPSGELLASVGADKLVVFYDIASFQPVGRTYTDSALTTCAFHPDGHLFAAGTSAGAIKLFMTTTLEEAAEFSLGAPVQSLVFSENGFWFAATAKGQTTATVFDLRKEGEAAKVKVLEAGGSVAALAWDFTGQFLATVGAGGLTVQQYAKASKAWTEVLRTSVAGVDVRWAAEGKKLVVANVEGVVTVLAAGE